MEPLNLIKNSASEYSAALDRMSNNGYKTIKQYDIDCSTLTEVYYAGHDVRKSDVYKTFFEEIGRMTGPVLYFFEVLSDNNADDIVSAVRNYKATAGSKAVPAIKKSYPKSNILYVGKVKKNFWGRIVQHFGYYHHPRTQGLQLTYWAKDKKIKLKLTAMEFEHEAAELMPLLERKFAWKLKPIIGRH